jgi:potassium channel
VAFSSPRDITHLAFDWIVEFFFVCDLVFNFFQEYKDPETYENIREHKKIALRYMFRGWFFIDFVSVFPFVAILQQDALITKLFRLFRLPRLIKLIDISRFNQLLRSFFESSSRDERIVAQYMLMYFYKIFRLIIIAIIITYFLG